MYMQAEYISPELPHTGWQRATERLAEFSWEARSKSNCPTVRRSRVLFLLQARPRKVGRPREELIIRYEPSRGERVVPVTKNERRRESEVKETEKETGWKKMEGERRERRRECNGKGKERTDESPRHRRCRRPSRCRPILLHVSPNSPGLTLRNSNFSDRSTRNAKWVTIKLGRRWREKKGIMI